MHSFKDENSTAMKVKIDTKEVFHVITIEEKELSANMAAMLMQIIDEKQSEDLKNLVLNFKDVRPLIHLSQNYLNEFVIHNMVNKNHLWFVSCQQI